MKRKYVPRLVGLAGLSLLLAGCGGSQNVIRTVPKGPAFLSGLWDGLTILVNFIAEIFNRKVGIYDVALHHNIAYNGGYLLGVSLFIIVISRFLP